MILPLVGTGGRDAVPARGETDTGTTETAGGTTEGMTHGGGMTAIGAPDKQGCSFCSTTIVGGAPPDSSPSAKRDVHKSWGTLGGLRLPELSALPSCDLPSGPRQGQAQAQPLSGPPQVFPLARPPQALPLPLSAAPRLPAAAAAGRGRGRLPGSAATGGAVRCAASRADRARGGSWLDSVRCVCWRMMRQEVTKL